MVRRVAPIRFRVREGSGRGEQKVGVSGAGDGVGSRRGELVGAQGVLSAGWLECRQSSKKMAVESELPFFTSFFLSSRSFTLPFLFRAFDFVVYYYIT